MDETRSIATLEGGQPALELQRPMLVVVEGTDVGRKYVLPEGPVVLGRGADAGVRLADPTTSRAHARLTPDGPGWRVRDLGSKQGTLVDEQPAGETRLEPGGTLRVGRTLLRLEMTKLLVMTPRQEGDRLGKLLGGSEVMRELFGTIRKVAPLELPVVLRGETGTGKEGVARALHEESPRRAGPYEVVDCTLLSEEHLRSELFGHVRGAFTGAASDRQGAFERAHGGTLFLDEIGEMPLELQATLLRVLQEGEVRPLGSGETRKVEVRVVAATHRDLPALVRAGKLREDLYYRLAAVELRVPPLRERLEDLVLLAEHFLPPGRRLSRAARQALEAHPWPGNVRELEQVLQVAHAMAPEGPIEPGHLQLRAAALQAEPGPAAATAAAPPPQTRAEFEEAEIRAALREHRHHRGKAAKALGIARSTLYERMKKYGIE